MLVDSSVWIDVLRARQHDRFRATVAEREIVTCLPVLQEVLQGFDAEPGYRLARITFAEVRLLEPAMQQDLYEEAIELYRTARRRALTIRSGVDCLIAACALRNGATVLHNDRDFDALASVSPVRTQRF